MQQSLWYQKMTMPKQSSIYIIIAAVYGLTAVILGTLGNHALGLEQGTKNMALFQHALFYMLMHALMLMWLSSQLQESFWIRSAAFSVTLGVLLFCGGLLLLIFWGKTSLSWLTPVGGSLIILAWLNVVIHGFKKWRKD